MVDLSAQYILSAANAELDQCEPENCEFRKLNRKHKKAMQSLYAQAQKHNKAKHALKESDGKALSKKRIISNRLAVGRYLRNVNKKETKRWSGQIREGHSLRLTPPKLENAPGWEKTQWHERHRITWRRTVHLLCKGMEAQYLCHPSEGQIEFFF